MPNVFLQNMTKIFLRTLLGILIPGFGVASLAPRIDTTYFEKSHQAYLDSFVSKKDVENVIPTDLTEDMSDSRIASKIADKSLTHFLKSPTIQNSYIGRTAKDVEKATQANLTVQSSQNSIAHKFKFQMLAFQSEAQIRYTGLTNALLRLELARSQVDFEISEPLTRAQEIVFNYQSGPNQTINQILLRMTF